MDSALEFIWSVKSLGWIDAILQTFEISIIIWIACVAGVALIILREETVREGTDSVQFADLVVGAGFLFLVALPTAA